MRTCFQFQTMSMLDHGQDIRAWYQDLLGFFYGPTPKKTWRLPSWFDKITRQMIEKVDDRIVELYQIYHDCGKPLCRTVDAEGKQHFPNHAEVSKHQWLAHFPEEKEVGELIGMDMDIHLLKAAGVEEFAARPQAITLLLTGLCELHSNAQMFGGVDSTGFKIKFKNLERFGRRIIDILSKSELFHYVVVRKDIPPGAQLAQSVHAAGESATPRPEPGTTAVVLHAADEIHLSFIRARLDKAELEYYCVFESEDDKHFPGQLMSIGLAPTTDRDAVRKVLSSLPLAK
jgi:hypothetical protein